MIPDVEWNEFVAELGKTAVARLPKKVWSRGTGFAPADVTCRVEPNPGGSQPIRVFFEIDWLHPNRRELIVETGTDFDQLKKRAYMLLIRALTNDAKAALELRSRGTQIINFDSRRDRFQAIEPGRYFVGKKNGFVRKVVAFINDYDLLWCDQHGAMTCSRDHLAGWSVAEVIAPEQMDEIERARRAHMESERNYLIQVGAAAVKARNDEMRAQSGGPSFR